MSLLRREQHLSYSHAAAPAALDELPLRPTGPHCSTSAKRERAARGPSFFLDPLRCTLPSVLCAPRNTLARSVCLLLACLLACVALRPLVALHPTPCGFHELRGLLISSHVTRCTASPCSTVRSGGANRRLLQSAGGSVASRGRHGAAACPPTVLVRFSPVCNPPVATCLALRLLFDACRLSWRAPRTWTFYRFAAQPSVLDPTLAGCTGYRRCICYTWRPGRGLGRGQMGGASCASCHTRCHSIPRYPQPCREHCCFRVSDRSVEAIG